MAGASSTAAYAPLSLSDDEDDAGSAPNESRRSTEAAADESALCSSPSPSVFDGEVDSCSLSSYCSLLPRCNSEQRIAACVIVVLAALLAAGAALLIVRQRVGSSSSNSSWASQQQRSVSAAWAADGYGSLPALSRPAASPAAPDTGTDDGEEDEEETKADTQEEEEEKEAYAASRAAAQPVFPPATAAYAAGSARYLVYDRYGRLSNGFIQLGHVLYAAYRLNRTLVTAGKEPLELIFNLSFINALFSRRLVISPQQFLEAETPRSPSSADPAVRPCTAVSLAVCLPRNSRCPRGCTRAVGFRTTPETEFTSSLSLQTLLQTQGEEALSRHRVIYISSLAAYRFDVRQSHVDAEYLRPLRARGWPSLTAGPKGPQQTPPYLTFTHPVWLHAVRLLLYTKARAAVGAGQPVPLDMYRESAATIAFLQLLADNEEALLAAGTSSRFAATMQLSHLFNRSLLLPPHYRIPVIGMHVRLEDKRGSVRLDDWVARADQLCLLYHRRVEEERQRCGWTGQQAAAAAAYYIGTDGNEEEKAELLSHWPLAQLECSDGLRLFRLCSSNASSAVLPAVLTQATLVLADFMLPGTTSSTFTHFIVDKRIGRLQHIKQALEAVTIALQQRRQRPADTTAAAAAQPDAQQPQEPDEAEREEEASGEGARAEDSTAAPG